MRVTRAGLHLCRTGSFKMQDVFDMVYSLLVFVNCNITQATALGTMRHLLALTL